jgi:hypothetical protein
LGTQLPRDVGAWPSVSCRVALLDEHMGNKRFQARRIGFVRPCLVVPAAGRESELVEHSHWPYYVAIARELLAHPGVQTALISREFVATSTTRPVCKKAAAAERQLMAISCPPLGLRSGHIRNRTPKRLGVLSVRH